MQQQLCFAIYRTVRDLVQKYNELLQPLELTYTQYLVMQVLWQNPKVTMKELGHKVCLDSNTLSPVIRRLVKKGYVEKFPSQQDKRVSYIRCLEAGRALEKEAQKIHDCIYDAVDLTEEEREELTLLLNKIQLHSREENA